MPPTSSQQQAVKVTVTSFKSLERMLAGLLETMKHQVIQDVVREYTKHTEVDHGRNSSTHTT